MPKRIQGTNSVKTSAVHRYKIARGHLDKVIRMLNEGEYCLNIVHQSIAVQAALKSADQIVLKNHLETCVVDSIKKGKSAAVIDEVMKTVEKM